MRTAAAKARMVGTTRSPSFQTGMTAVSWGGRPARQGRRSVTGLQIAPAASSARIHGITSSSISESVVVGLEAEHVARLADVRHAVLDVVLEGRVGDPGERAVGPVDLAPDQLARARGRSCSSASRG